MIITSLEELRLAAPTHALDSFDNIAGVVGNTEHDVLEEKLGTPLYTKLCQWYEQNPNERSNISAQVLQGGTYTDISPWNRLWLVSLRVVAYSVLARNAGQQAVSVNNAGLNQFSAEGYQPATKDAIDTYRQTNLQEAAAACNQLLRLLEQWTKAVAAADAANSVPASSAGGSAATVPDASASGITDETKEIVALWRHSRYFYLSTSLLIPTATCLQQYINFSENRDRFIQMLPDLLFIQEEQIANAIGEDFLQWLVAEGLKLNTDVPVSTVLAGSASENTDVTPIIRNIIHRLRKAMAALLVERTAVLRFTKDQRIQAHDDAVRMLDVACTYIRNHQPDILQALDATVNVSVLDGSAVEEAIEQARTPFLTSPLYIKEEAATVPEASASGKSGCVCCGTTAAKDPNRTYAKGDPAAWTPPLF